MWATHVLLAPADDVRAALRRYDRVFLTHVNTPQEASSRATRSSAAT